MSSVHYLTSSSIISCKSSCLPISECRIKLPLTSSTPKVRPTIIDHQPSLSSSPSPHFLIPTPSHSTPNSTPTPLPLPPPHPHPHLILSTKTLRTSTMSPITTPRRMNISIPITIAIPLLSTPIRSSARAPEGRVTLEDFGGVFAGG